MVDSRYVVHDRRYNLIKRLGQLSLDGTFVINVKSFKNGLIEETFGCVIWLVGRILIAPAAVAGQVLSHELAGQIELLAFHTHVHHKDTHGETVIVAVIGLVLYALLFHRHLAKIGDELCVAFSLAINPGKSKPREGHFVVRDLNRESIAKQRPLEQRLLIGDDSAKARKSIVREFCSRDADGQLRIVRFGGYCILGGIILIIISLIIVRGSFLIMPDVQRKFWYPYENNMVVVNQSNEDLAQKILAYIRDPYGSNVVPPDYMNELRKERKREIQEEKAAALEAEKESEQEEA